MTFWKPGAKAPGLEPPPRKSFLDRENEKDGEGADSSSTGFLVYNPNANLGMQQQRMRLPIFQNSKSLNL
jgi:hypothetical protein